MFPSAGPQTTGGRTSTPELRGREGNMPQPTPTEGGLLHRKT